MKKGKSWSVRLPRVSLRLPTVSINFPVLRGIRMSGGRLLAGSMGIIAIIFAAGLLLVMNTGEPDPTWPDAGAVYTAPSKVGIPLANPEDPEVRSQTVQINLPSGIRLDEISFYGTSLGKSGLTASLEIQGTTTAYIVVDDIIFRDSEFPTLDFANSEFYDFVATSTVEAAGHTISYTPSTSTSDITVGSVRGAANYSSPAGKIVDRIVIKIDSSATSDAIIGRIVFDGVKASVGGVDLDYVKAGKLLMENVKVGDDGDIDSPDFVINPSVSVNNMTETVVDKPVNIR